MLSITLLLQVPQTINTLKICTWICAWINYVSYTLVCVHFIVCSTRLLLLYSVIFQSCKFSYPVDNNARLTVSAAQSTRIHKPSEFRLRFPLPVVVSSYFQLCKVASGHFRLLCWSQTIGFTIDRFFFKLFQTSSIEIDPLRQSFLSFELPSACDGKKCSKSWTEIIKFAELIFVNCDCHNFECFFLSLYTGLSYGNSHYAAYCLLIFCFRFCLLYIFVFMHFFFRCYHYLVNNWLIE